MANNNDLEKETIKLNSIIDAGMKIAIPFIIFFGQALWNKVDGMEEKYERLQRETITETRYVQGQKELKEYLDTRLNDIGTKVDFMVKILMERKKNG